MTPAWLRPIARLTRHPVMIAGAVLTTSSAFTMIGFWIIELLIDRSVHAYAGIILFLILPGVFVFGLLLIPVGAFLARRQGPPPAQIDLGSDAVRSGVAWVALATILNVVLLSTATYRGVVYMDSTQFCGLACHSVMAPQYTAYQGSPHSRVSCTECHIGPGAPWFVRSKLSGARQLVAVTLGTHSRPIPSPVHDLRPSRDTCEHCHWPQKLHGDRLVVRRKFADDEANTPLTSVLVMKIGGRTGTGGASGIHGSHLDAVRGISYLATDERRLVIPRVIVHGNDGKDTEYVSTDIKPSAEELARGERRTMDCIDCHNRPTHAFELPERAVDKALAEGRISRELPFVKKTGVALLKVEYADRDTAARRIEEGLTEYYRTNHPDAHRQHRAQIQAAAQQLRQIYLRNVFPQMKVGWGTYPNHIGHSDYQGCFRCHDDMHKSASGKAVSQDCALCHTILAHEEADPKILADLGIGAP